MSREAKVKIIKSNVDQYQDVIRKSDKPEQLDPSVNISATDWIPQPFDLRGLEALVQHSTILPQCIRAYKNNIAGFGVSIKYCDDIEETPETSTEWDFLERTLDLLNLDTDTKEVFEKVIEDREMYGIAYIECLRNMDGQIVGIDNIDDVASMEMTYPLLPYVDIEWCYKGEFIQRKKKFRKFRQTVAGKTVYFKEIGDPRVMDKRTGRYIDEGEVLDLDMQANEIMDFTVGKGYYGTVRWIGAALTVDGDYRAENLNNNYFRNGRHTPLMIIVKGGTLSDESFEKLQQYMNDIKGEAGQHAFMVLETEEAEKTVDYAESSQPSIEIKDLAGILQSDGLFQEYQEKCRKKVQSAFLLPDLYVGYTTDFNRATAQVAMEVTEKQVFQPERLSLAWQVNNKLLNGYGFRYVECIFDQPDITNPEDITKILNITERAGGLTLNDARSLTMETLGRESEDYPTSFDMDDIGNIPLAVLNSLRNMQNSPYGSNMEASAPIETSTDEQTDITEDTELSDQITDQLDGQIEKAMRNRDDEIVSVMKSVRRMLVKMEGDENAEV